MKARAAVLRSLDGPLALLDEIQLTVANNEASETNTMATLVAISPHLLIFTMLQPIYRCPQQFLMFG
jgi:hypothetical protein